MRTGTPAGVGRRRKMQQAKVTRLELAGLLEGMGKVVAEV